MEAAHEGVAGKTAWLVAEVGHYRAELTFDFRHELGMPLAEVGESIPWAEAVLLVEQLGERPGTHYWSARHGFTAPTTYGELAVILQAQAVINLLRPKGSDPVKLPIPLAPDEVETVTPEERKELVEYARATAPFPLDD